MAPPIESNPEERVRRLRQILGAFRAQLSANEASSDPADFDRAMEDFLRFVSTGVDRDAYARLEAAGEIAGFRRFFASRVLRFTWAAEQAAYAKIMARCAAGPGHGAGPRPGEHPWGAYHRMKSALAAMDLSACRSAVMAGCGPLPDTLLCLHDETDIPRLVGIDRDGEAVQRARDLVDRLGCRRIEIIQAAAGDFDYGGFDLICPSAFVAPRRGLMRKIAGTADPSCRILLRAPVFAGTLLFEPLELSLLAYFEVQREIDLPPGRFQLSYSVMALRAASRNERSR